MWKKTDMVYWLLSTASTHDNKTFRQRLVSRIDTESDNQNN